jgi:hypothetical protein
MANEYYLPQVDYTSRDYAAIRDDLITLIPNFVPQWTSRDASDFGIVLLELFAYVGDLLNYYTDRAANEGFITTATQRQTILDLAKLLNYTPNGISPSTGTVTLTNGTASAIAVLAGTLISATNSTTNNSVIFQTDSDITIPARSGSVDGTGSVGITQGQTIYDETVGYSDGSPSQIFKLSTPSVITEVGSTYSIQVTVGSDDYSLVSNIVDYYSDSKVFYTVNDAEGYTYLAFGDGTHGVVPTINNTITVTYRVCDGSVGNIAAESINAVLNDINGNYPAVTASNSAATSGGADAETTDEIRENAPKALRSLNRAVSLDDYANLALQVPGVAKASSIATAYTAVTIYVAASGGGALSDSLKGSILEYFNGKTLPGVTTTVIDYSPVYPDVRLTVYLEPQASSSRTAAAVKTALLELFNFSNVNFNDKFTNIDVLMAVNDVAGVAYAELNGLIKKTSVTDTAIPGSVATIYCNINEVIKINEDFINITTSGGTV